MKQFTSLGAFAEHIAKLAITATVSAELALEKSAQIVEKRAKDKIGDYQEQAGLFIAWPELAEATKADRLRQGFSEDEPLLRTGALRDSIEHAVSASTLEAQIGSNSDIAVYQELGTEHIPPRSFLGGAMVESLPEIRTIAQTAVVAALVGEDVYRGALRIKE